MTPEVARIFALLPRSGKPGWRRGRLPLPLAARTAAEGLIGPFPLHLDALLPVSCLDRIPLALAHGILDRDAGRPGRCRSSRTRARGRASCAPRLQRTRELSAAASRLLRRWRRWAALSPLKHFDHARLIGKHAGWALPTVAESSLLHLRRAAARRFRAAL
jgi:hypothetical protein